jgi:hypothetical protein
VTRDDLRRWIADYQRAWRTGGTEPLRTLFAAGASYSPGPYERAHVGLDEIAAFWEAEREGPEEPFTMDAVPVAVEGDTGVVRVQVHYDGPPVQEYRDLWIVTLDAGGRCTAFEEWPFWPEQSRVADGR